MQKDRDIDGIRTAVLEKIEYIPNISSTVDLINEEESNVRCYLSASQPIIDTLNNDDFIRYIEGTSYQYQEKLGYLDQENWLIVKSNSQIKDLLFTDKYLRNGDQTSSSRESHDIKPDENSNFKKLKVGADNFQVTQLSNKVGPTNGCSSKLIMDNVTDENKNTSTELKKGHITEEKLNEIEYKHVNMGDISKAKNYVRRSKSDCSIDNTCRINNFLLKQKLKKSQSTEISSQFLKGKSYKIEDRMSSYNRKELMDDKIAKNNIKTAMGFSPKDTIQTTDGNFHVPIQEPRNTSKENNLKKFQGILPEIGSYNGIDNKSSVFSGNEEQRNSTDQLKFNSNVKPPLINISAYVCAQDLKKVNSKIDLESLEPSTDVLSVYPLFHLSDTLKNSINLYKHIKKVVSIKDANFVEQTDKARTEKIQKNKKLKKDESSISKIKEDVLKVEKTNDLNALNHKFGLLELSNVEYIDENNLPKRKESTINEEDFSELQGNVLLESSNEPSATFDVQKQIDPIFLDLSPYNVDSIYKAITHKLSTRNPRIKNEIGSESQSRGSLNESQMSSGTKEVNDSKELRIENSIEKELIQGIQKKDQILNDNIILQVKESKDFLKRKPQLTYLEKEKKISINKNGRDQSIDSEISKLTNGKESPLEELNLSSIEKMEGSIIDSNEQSKKDSTKKHSSLTVNDYIKNSQVTPFSYDKTLAVTENRKYFRIFDNENKLLCILPIYEERGNIFVMDIKLLSRAEPNRTMPLTCSSIVGEDMNVSSESFQNKTSRYIKGLVQITSLLDQLKEDYKENETDARFDSVDLAVSSIENIQEISVGQSSILHDIIANLPLEMNIILKKHPDENNFTKIEKVEMKNPVNVSLLEKLNDKTSQINCTDEYMKDVLLENDFEKRLSTINEEDVISKSVSKVLNTQGADTVYVPMTMVSLQDIGIHRDSAQSLDDIPKGDITSSIDNRTSFELKQYISEETCARVQEQLPEKSRKGESIIFDLITIMMDDTKMTPEVRYPERNLKRSFISEDQYKSIVISEIVEGFEILPNIINDYLDDVKRMNDIEIFKENTDNVWSSKIFTSADHLKLVYEKQSTQIIFWAKAKVLSINLMRCKTETEDFSSARVVINNHPDNSLSAEAFSYSNFDEICEVSERNSYIMEPQPITGAVPLETILIIQPENVDIFRSVTIDSREKAWIYLTCQYYMLDAMLNETLFHEYVKISKGLYFDNLENNILLVEECHFSNTTLKPMDIASFSKEVLIEGKHYLVVRKHATNLCINEDKRIQISNNVKEVVVDNRKFNKVRRPNTKDVCTEMKPTSNSKLRVLRRKLFNERYLPIKEKFKVTLDSKILPKQFPPMSDQSEQTNIIYQERISNTSNANNVEFYDKFNIKSISNISLIKHQSLYTRLISPKETL